MDEQQIFQFVAQYGYVILLPLMIIEGPIVTILGAFLASVGMLNIWVVLTLSVIGDMIGDVIFYGIGHRWGMKFVDHVGKFIGITKKIVLRLEKYFMRHGGKTIFMVKATTGLCWATFVAAGIVKMPFKRFVAFSFLGGVLWSGFLAAMGYFFGYLYEQIVQYISYAGWIIAGLACIVLFAIALLKKHETEEMFADVIGK